MLSFSRQGVVGDRSGTAAVEFALVFPIMATLFLGSFEISNLVMAYLKVTASVEAAADLVAQTRAQTPAIQPSDLTNYTTAAQLVMAPLPMHPTGQPTVNNFLISYAGVNYTGTNGTAKVAWHQEENGSTAITTGSLDQPTLAGLGSGTDTIVVVQVQYNYTSPISYVLGKTYTITDIAYNRPRYVTGITCAACT